MKTKVLLTIAAVILVIISTVAIGSNMGFKISIPLYAYSGGTHTGFNWVSLPFYNSYTTASVAFADIPSCVELDLYNETTGGYRVYDADLFLDDFPIATGGELVDANALLVKVGGNGNWIVVGSHAPSKNVPLYAYSVGAHTGFNWRAIPYHTTSSSASVLFGEVPNCVELDLYNETTGGYRVYDADLFLDDFPITAGLPVLIKVGTSSSTWQPNHY